MIFIQSIKEHFDRVEIQLNSTKFSLKNNNNNHPNICL